MTADRQPERYSRTIQIYRGLRITIRSEDPTLGEGSGDDWQRGPSIELHIAAGNVDAAEDEVEQTYIRLTRDIDGPLVTELIEALEQALGVSDGFAKARGYYDDFGDEAEDGELDASRDGSPPLA